MFPWFPEWLPPLRPQEDIFIELERGHSQRVETLHLMGLDHEKLTFHYSGRNFRLTDVSGKLMDGVLA